MLIYLETIITHLLKLCILGTHLVRAKKALKMMGTAILNGGMTTFLAVILLSDSTSHGLITFFKVFLLTVLFGLFHAIAFLPVVLCIQCPSIGGSDKDKNPAQREKSMVRSKSSREDGNSKGVEVLQAGDLTTCAFVEPQNTPPEL